MKITTININIVEKIISLNNLTINNQINKFVSYVMKQFLTAMPEVGLLKRTVMKL